LPLPQGIRGGIKSSRDIRGTGGHPKISILMFLAFFAFCGVFGLCLGLELCLGHFGYSLSTKRGIFFREIKCRFLEFLN